MRRSLRQLANHYLRRDTPLFASSMSLAACVFLAIVGVILGRWEESLMIQTNGYISLIDIGNSVLFLAAVDRSTRRADLVFNYGYGKYESLAILVSANLLIALAIVTMVQAVNIIQSPPQTTNAPLLLGWSALSFIIMRRTARRLEKYANRFHQPMLRYDAELWRVDSYVELGVVGCVVVDGVLQSTGWYSTAAAFDSLASIALVLLTLKVPLKHGSDAFRQLTDRTLPENMQQEILDIISGAQGRMCEFRNLHTRQSGRDIFVEIDLVMPSDYRLDELYPLELELVAKIRKRFPTAIPRVYVMPCDGWCNRADGTSACPVKNLASELQSERSG